MGSTIAEVDALAYRQRYRGLIGVAGKIPVRDRHILSLVYTPGVAAPCLEIAKEPRTSFDYRCRWPKRRWTCTVAIRGSSR